MKRIQVWSVEEEDGRLRAKGLDEIASAETEQRLEELLVATPELLLDGLSLIGRQLPSEAGILDLLGIDRDGRLVLLELKRGTLTREAVAQILDYVSELTTREPEQLSRLIESHSGRHGIEPVGDFLDWYAREFPDSAGPLEKTPRMVLVGLGVDERAKRIVNFLADSGIDIQLLTFHAFRSGGALLLAKQVETATPATPQATEKWTKEDNRRALLQLAEERGAAELLKDVADFIVQAGSFYRWPGKTAYSFSLPGRTEEGRPTSHTYLTLYVHPKKRGALLLTLAPRAEEAAPGAVGRLLSTPFARRKDSSWTPVEIDVDGPAWPTIQPLLSEMIAELETSWRRANEEASVAEETAETEMAEAVAEIDIKDAP
jgi:hypothetical protein